jgi:putative radical SAM enzyme (TIGR03279 family)
MGRHHDECRGGPRRRDDAGLPVADVRDAARRAGLRAGDRIERVNGVPAADVLDVELGAADGPFQLHVTRDGRPLDLVVEPYPQEWHGISLAYGGLGVQPRVCRNRCRFCFVDQVPPGLRPALYVKDDDYRLSFLHGNFTTLGNVDEDDLSRILELRLSPLYVSLHAWDDDARVRLMGEAARGTRAALEQLAAAGVELHLQVVFCPGWNDGDVLRETVLKAAALPSVADLGIVPVSLAAEGDLRRVTPSDAAGVLERVAAWQARHRKDRGVAFVHAADEFHLLCGKLPPSSDAPEQYENGIGMAAALLEEAAALGAGPEGPRGVRVLTGTLAEPVIEQAGVLLSRDGAPVRPFAVSNVLFGPHVTVTGLLGGAEVLAALRERPLGEDEWLVAPRVFLPAALGRSLDDVGEDELAAACGGRLVLSDSLAAAFGTLTR